MKELDRITTLRNRVVSSAVTSGEILNASPSSFQLQQSGQFAKIKIMNILLVSNANRIIFIATTNV